MMRNTFSLQIVCIKNLQKNQAHTGGGSKWRSMEMAVGGRSEPQHLNKNTACQPFRQSISLSSVLWEVSNLMKEKEERKREISDFYSF